MSGEKLNKDGLMRLWHNFAALIKVFVGDVDVKNKGDLQTQVDDLDKKIKECFQSASDGKELVANAITGKGVLTLATDTFATIAANIAKIKTAATLQSKSAVLNTSTTSVTMKPDSGYDGLSQATVSITLQEKIAALSTAAQNITPDSGKLLSKVTVPAISGTAVAGDVLIGKTFSSGAAGVGEPGTMANKGAWTGATTGSGNVAIPAGYHNGSGYVSGAGAYNKGVSDADARVNANSANYKAGYNAGVSAADGRTNADSANYKSGYNAGVSATKKGTAAAGDVLTGKTFTNESSVGASGSMANRGGTTVDAGAVTQDDDYTYFAVPANGYYNTNSKLRAQNSNLGLRIGDEQTVKKDTAFEVINGKYYLFALASTGWSSSSTIVITGGELITSIRHSVAVPNTTNTKAASVATIIKATASSMTIDKAGTIIPIT